MTKPRSTRIFKSGNSKAVRIPAEWALEAGQEVVVREEAGRYVIEPVKDDAAWRAALVATFGSVPDLRPLSPDERLIEERDLPWHLLDGSRD